MRIILTRPTEWLIYGELTPEQRFNSECYVMQSYSNRKPRLYDQLTEEEKNDIIEVDGKRYIRKIYEANHKNKKEVQQ